jgi:predicted phosphodiesterase
MKREILLQVVSDLHGEVPGAETILKHINFSAKCDIAILAGDVASHQTAAELAASLFSHAGAIVMIAGNHEYYGIPGKMDDALKMGKSNVSRLRKQGVNIHLLENEVVSIPVRGHDVHIAGATLWTDYGLYGPNNEITARRIGYSGINDFRRIGELVQHHGDFLSATHILQNKNFVSKKFIKEFLGSTAAPKIVVTHHLPSLRSISPRYAGSSLSPSFASNMDDLIAMGGRHLALWLHGHTHASSYWKDKGGTLTVCNPAGYPKGAEDNWVQFENSEFYQDFVLRLSYGGTSWSVRKMPRKFTFSE